MEEWHKGFIELMFSKNRTLETISAAADIKYQHMPNALYKFRCFTENALTALQNDCLYSSSPSQLNDIREAPISISTEKIKQTVLQKAYNNARKSNPLLPEARIANEYDLAAIYREINSQNNEDACVHFPKPSADPFINSLVAASISMIRTKAEEALHVIRNTYNICSFSASRDEDLMWAHYADSHRGFCIEYDFKSNGIKDKKVQLLFPVIYQDQPLVLIDDLEEINGNTAMYALTIKSLRWNYEQEWRGFFVHTEQPNPEPMPKPKAIYLGEKCERENKQKMGEICEKKRIPLYQMVLPNMTSSLEPRRIL